MTLAEREWVKGTTTTARAVDRYTLLSIGAFRIIYH